jgi:hypothetical protein
MLDGQSLSLNADAVLLSAEEATDVSVLETALQNRPRRTVINDVLYRVRLSPPSAPILLHTDVSADMKESHRNNGKSVNSAFE